MPRSITIPIGRANYIAEAVLPHVANDDVTPALTLGVIREGRLYGSDRYSVGCVTLDPPRPDGFDGWREDQRVGWLKNSLPVLGGEVGEDDPTWDDEFTIPRAAIARMKTIGKTQTVNGIFAETVVVVREEFTPWRDVPSRRVGPIKTEATRTRDRYVVVEVRHGEVLEYLQRYSCAQGNVPPFERLFENWEPAEEGTPVNFTGLQLGKVTKFSGAHSVIRLKPGKAVRKGAAGPTLLEVGKDFRALLQPTLGA